MEAMAMLNVGAYDNFQGDGRSVSRVAAALLRAVFLTSRANRAHTLAAILFVGPAVAEVASQSSANVPTFRVTREWMIEGAAAGIINSPGVCVHPSGRLAIPDRHDFRIHLFDAMGRQVGVGGRRGEGPGEFRLISRSCGWQGDFAWLFDSGLLRISFFDTNGRFARSIRATITGTLPGAASSAGGVNQLTPIAILPDGRRIAKGFTAAEAVTVMMSSAGAITRVLFREPRSTSVTGRTSDGMSLGYPIPFFHRSHAAASPDGRHVIRVTTAPRAGDRAAITVTRLGASGDTAFSRTIEVRSLRVTPHMRDSIGKSLQRGATAEVAAFISRELLPRIPEIASPLRGRTDVVESLVVGADTTTWIGLRPVGTTAEWLVLSPRGATIRSVRLPADAFVVAALGDNVWVRSRDDDGFVQYGRYRLVPN
jgi:hypothetical protein